MKTKFSVWLASAALALIGSIPPAMADEWNKETRLEINEPLEIPGMVLIPGTYIFKLADSASDRTIVQVFSEDGNGRQKLVTTIFAVSAYTLNTPEKPMINLEERPAGNPQAIHTWFYPGDNNGWEFVYPKSNRPEVAEASAPAPPPAPPVAALDTPALPVVEAPVSEPPAVLPVKEEVASAPVEKPVLVAFEENTLSVELPATAGHSSAELLAGAMMLGAGLILVFAARSVTQA
jgi:hypothetical protein